MSTHPEGGLRVAVVGAGLGGLAAAIGLRRAGHTVSVFEQATALGDVGAGISLAPNSTGALFDLGLEAPLTPLAVRPESFVWRRWTDGARLGGYPLADEAEDRFGHPYWHLHRADLHRALVDTALAPAAEGAPVTITLGATVVRTDTGNIDAPGRLRLVDGTLVEADVILGADGIHSTVRRGLFGAESPRDSGDVAYRALIPAADVPSGVRHDELIGGRDITAWLGPGRHVVHYWIRGGAELNLLAIAPSERAKGQPVESWSATVDRAVLRDAFNGWDERFLELCERAPSVGRWALLDREPLPHWTRGRVALLGDACHAMLPYKAQGAAQAIEDGGAISRVLTGASAAQVIQRLADYESERRPTATAVQSASRASAGVLHLADGEAQRARDARLGAGAGGLDSQEGIWSR